MNKVLKYILLSVCGGLIGLCIMCSYIAGSKYRRSLKCERLVVRVLDSTVNHFVSPKDIRTLLNKSYGQYIGCRADSIDLVKIEEIVQSKSAVLTSEAYMTNDGALNIDITQRRPVVRFQKKGGGFYADQDGYIFPLQNTFASHVQIVDGNIPLAANSGYKGELCNPKERQWVKNMVSLVNYMKDKSMWRDKIVQIHINGDGNIVLIPRIGEERFIFGQPDRFDEKFSRLEKYYTAIRPQKSSGSYKEVDLRFRGQIICR